MKKIILSLSVVVSFLFYALLQKGQGSKNISLVPPLTISTSLGQTVSPQGQSQTYQNGEFVGSVEDAYYGNVQVKAVISQGKIIDVVFLDYPHDRQTSVMINTQAMPYLKQEAIQAQSSQVDIVSGASATSAAFIRSLASALVKAQKL